MKKLMLLGLLLGSTIFVQAQTKTDSLNKTMGQSGNNEIKINLLHSILGLIEVNYERILGDNTGLGLGAFVSVSGEDFDYNYGFVPHYRVYFGAKKASGFFIEGNMAFISVKEGANYYAGSNYTNFTYHSVDKLNFGFGAAAGAKFLTKNGFLGEAYLGLGRFVGSNRSVEAYPRIGITIGKRF